MRYDRTLGRKGANADRMNRKRYIQRFTRSTREWEGINFQHDTPPSKQKRNERKRLRQADKRQLRQEIKRA